MKLKTTLFGNVYQFKDVKEVLAKANELRSGDVLAGVAAESSQQRVAAKQVLSDMTVADIRNNPVIPYEEDCVTRLIQDDVERNRLSADQTLDHQRPARIRAQRRGHQRRYRLCPQRADLRGGGGGGQDLLQRRSDLWRQKNAGDQKSQYHHRSAGDL